MFVVKRALKPAAAFGVATAFRQVRFPSSFPGDAPRRAASRRIVDATIGAFLRKKISSSSVVARAKGSSRLSPDVNRLSPDHADEDARAAASRDRPRSRPTLTTETPLVLLTHTSTTSVNHENRLPTLPTCATSVRAVTRRT